MSESEEKRTDESEKSEVVVGDENEVSSTVDSNVPKNIQDLEKEEEAKLRAKYPSIKGSGSSALLQKRLSKGTKYFDSGDYAMAKAKTGPSKQPLGPGQKMLLPGSTGDTIPTPEMVPHKRIGGNQRKLSGLS